MPILLMYYKNHNTRGGYFEYLSQYVKQIPIHKPNLQERNLFESFVEQILELNKRLATAQTAHERTLLQRQIAATDHQIDQLVYQLYDLTPAEIAIVEGQS